MIFPILPEDNVQTFMACNCFSGNTVKTLFYITWPLMQKYMVQLCCNISAMQSAQISSNTGMNILHNDCTVQKDPLIHIMLLKYSKATLDRLCI